MLCGNVSDVVGTVITQVQSVSVVNLMIFIVLGEVHPRKFREQSLLVFVFAFCLNTGLNYTVESL